jgi:selenocysteine-specific elongation factor
MATAPLIIGTAGHIDHGKTSMVRALTGVNLDSLPEEQQRGITISLGFTHLDLGQDRRAAFVDVPGHEKLVRTMIAGATGLDAVVLCVAANEGVMPQTREHLDILGLLGLERGIIALTKCDLADEEMLELAMLDVEESVQGTFLEGAPVVCTAVGNKPQGLDEIRSLIADLVAIERTTDGWFRLPIDRAFVQRGFGTVVTGTARGGVLRDGSPVWIQPLGISSRVRGLQVHGNEVQDAQAGQRTAVNLAGIERDDLARGMVVLNNPDIEPASVIDTQLRMLDQAATITSGSHVRLLVGTAEVLAVAHVLDGDALVPGQTHWVQLRTETPIVALPGDRFVIRRESPMETLGGGTIFDPWARRARKKLHAQLCTEISALAEGNHSMLLQRAGPAGLSPEQAQVRQITDGLLLGDRILHSHHVDVLAGHLLAALSDWHATHPLEPGAPRRSVHSGALAALTEKAFDALIAHQVKDGTIKTQGPRCQLATFTVELNAEQVNARESMLQDLLSAAYEGLLFSDLIRDQNPMLQLLIDAGLAVRVGERVLHTEMLDQLRAAVSTFFSTNNELSPSSFKEITGLSRRTAIPLLEWLDATGITRREGNARVRC